MRVRALLVIGLAAVALGAAGPAAAAPAPSGTPFAERTLTIQTVPEVPGLRFVFEGQTYRSNAQGRVFLPHAAVEARKPPRPVDGHLSNDVRVEFARYFGDQHSGKITATYDVYHRVEFEFTDIAGHPIPPEAVESMTFRSSIGYRGKVEDVGKALWLQGARVVPESATRRAIKNILYRIEEVFVHGTNVVNRAEQSFEPRFQRLVALQLLYYTATFTSRDAFFGFSLGDTVKLTFPDGTVRRYELGPDGEVTVPSLPRGEYDVTVEGDGIPISRPLSLSTNSALQVEVLSYLDIGVVVAFLVLFIVGLPLARRPHLARLPFEWVRGRLGRGSSRPGRGAGADRSRAPEEGAEPLAAEVNGTSPDGEANGARPPSRTSTAATRSRRRS
jgi:hypothetical protein